MDKVKIDFLKAKYQLDASRSHRPAARVAKFLIVGVLVTAVAGAAFSYRVSNGSDAAEHFPSLSLFSTIKQLVRADDRKLQGEEEDRVNVLLMGVGGEGHEGGQLSDTMILASLQPSTKKVGMLSIPRDLTVPIPGHGLRKINAANAYAEREEPGSGPVASSEVVENVLDQEVHYFLRVDFSGFAQLIDDIGGVDIYVDNAFTDYQYPSHGMSNASCGTSRAITNADGETVSVPTYGCRYEVLSFDVGWVHMDGDTALKYVRSRHGNNGEGSDFARSRRQQKVLLAAKEKLLSAGTFLNPARINRIRETLQDNISTNLSTWELVKLAQDYGEIELGDITHHVLDTAPGSPLYGTSLNGAYVILPKNDDWRPVQALAANIFEENPSTTVATSSGGGEEKPKFTRVEIQNGTGINGLAFRTSQLLGTEGYEVTKIGNAASRNYEHTVIYDLTNGQKGEELKELRDALKADVTLSATGWLMTTDVVPKELTLSPDEYEGLATADNIDFLVILGEHAAQVVRR